MGKNTGGPAFPFEYHNQTNSNQRSFFTDNLVSPNGSEQYAGMTLRDFFAAKAMQGYLSNSWQAKEMDETGDSASEQMYWVAEASYAMADAMLKARGE